MDTTVVDPEQIKGRNKYKTDNQKFKVSERGTVTTSGPETKVEDSPKQSKTKKKSNKKSAGPSKGKSSEPSKVKSSEPSKVKSSELTKVMSSKPSTVKTSELSTVKCAEPSKMKSAKPSKVKSAEPSKKKKRKSDEPAGPEETNQFKKNKNNNKKKATKSVEQSQQVSDGNVARLRSLESNLDEEFFQNLASKFGTGELGELAQLCTEMRKFNPDTLSDMSLSDDETSDS